MVRIGSSAINGSSGKDGDIGPIGPTGPAGAAGPAGADGPAGKDADTTELTKKVASLEKKVRDLKAIVDHLSIDKAEEGNVLAYDAAKKKFMPAALE
jgi:hypothetical protein